MAMRNENDLPELVPFEDRLPSPGDLLRTPEEITDDQFALLAAAWAEGGMNSESLSEMESVFTAHPAKRALAEDFKKIRIAPGSEKWPGLEACLRPSRASKSLKPVMYISLAAAAVLLAFFVLSPLLRVAVTQSSPFMLPVAEISADAGMPAGIVNPPVDRMRAVYAKNIPASVSLPEQQNRDAAQIPKVQPLDLRNYPETIRIIASASTAELGKMTMVPAIGDFNAGQEDMNWIIRGITAITNIGKRDNKPLDGYLIAGACVKGVNAFLGWEMELEKVMSDDGNPLAVNFSSSLVSFSSPVKKSSPE